MCRCTRAWPCLTWGVGPGEVLLAWGLDGRVEVPPSVSQIPCPETVGTKSPRATVCVLPAGHNGVLGCGRAHQRVTSSHGQVGVRGLRDWVACVQDLWAWDPALKAQASAAMLGWSGPAVRERKCLPGQRGWGGGA